MKAKLKELHSPDIDINNYQPKDASSFSFLLEASIGLENSEGADIFQFIICTPDWIKSKYVDKKLIFARNMLIVFEYDLAVIKMEIEKWVDSCVGENWISIAQKLSRIGKWEFEDYKP